MTTAVNDKENIVSIGDGNSESDAELDAVLGSDEDPDEYETEGINDGDPDMELEEGQSLKDESGSSGSEVDAIRETRYQARDGDFEDAINLMASNGKVSGSSESVEGGLLSDSKIRSCQTEVIPNYWLQIPQTTYLTPHERKWTITESIRSFCCLSSVFPFTIPPSFSQSKAQNMCHFARVRTFSYFRGSAIR